MGSPIPDTIAELGEAVAVDLVWWVVLDDLATFVTTEQSQVEDRLANCRLSG